MAVQRWTDEMLDALSSDVAAIQVTLAQVADLQVDLARAMGRLSENQTHTQVAVDRLLLGHTRLQESMAEIQAEVRALTAGQARMQEAITESQAMIRTLAAGQEQQQRILEQFMRRNSDSP